MTFVIRMRRLTMNVADLKPGGKDSNENLIQKFYAHWPPHYDVYKADNLVCVHLADDDVIDSDGRTLEENQRRELAKINGLRAQIHGLIDSWRTSERFKPKADRY